MKPRDEALRRIPVSEINIKKAAIRLLNQTLVSSEIHYVQRVLGHSATQTDIDANVLSVRKLPWASIVVDD